jgi:hypothetical protein
MLRLTREEVMRKMLVTLLLLTATSALAEEKLSAVDLSVRTAMTFKVNDAALQKLLPAGFAMNPPAAGPTKGANLAITLIDYLMVQDPEGKPLPPRTTVAINIPSKKTATGEAVGLVIGGFILEAGAPGAYFNFGASKINVNRQSHTVEGKSIIDETWDIKGNDGNALEVVAQFERGALTRAKAEAKIHSGAKPEFYRIYKFEQAADVARSTATGVDRVTKFSIKATGPRFAPVFNGSEQLVSITSVPSYSRSIFVPVM